MKRRVNHLLLLGLCGLVSMAACGENGGDPSQDTISITITSPATQTYVNGLVQVTVAVTGEVSRVELLVDDRVVGQSEVAPYTINWDTTAGDEALFRLRVVAYGPREVQQSSVEHQVVVDRTPPTVELVDLNLPYVFSGEATLEAASSDANGVVEMRLAIDGVDQTDCTVDSCQVTWDTLTVADGAAELTAEAVDGAGNVTTLVRPVAVVNDGTIVTFYDGSGTGLYAIPANWADLDLHQKRHFDMPAATTEVMAVGQWYDVTWEMEVDLGIGFCPHSGVTQVEQIDDGGQILLHHTTDATDLSPEEWFLHIGTSPGFDMEGHIDDGTYFALTVAVY